METFPFILFTTSSVQLFLQNERISSGYSTNWGKGAVNADELKTSQWKGVLRSEFWHIVKFVYLNTISVLNNNQCVVITL